jgi:hypothetical protein
MTGIPQFNYPKFQEAAARLREHGHEIISPAEQDPPETQAEAMASPDGKAGTTKETWGDMLARDVKIVSDMVDGIVFLPGWDRSRGARLEAFVGLLCGKAFAYYDGSPALAPIVPIDAAHVRTIIKRNLP